MIKDYIPPHYFLLKETLGTYGLGENLGFLGSHDGVHYLSIAKHGYNMYEQAFFPLFPISISFLGYVSWGHYLPLAILVNISCTLISISQLRLLTRFIFTEKEKQIEQRTFYWFLFFPTSFFYFVAYNESIYWLCSLIFLNALISKKPVLAMISGFLAASTRLVGVFLIIPSLYFYFSQNRSYKKTLLVMIGPILGLLSYMTYLWKTVGDPLFFLNAQPAFGANRSTQIILLPQVIYRYLKIFLTANHDFVFWIAVLEILSLSVSFLCFWQCLKVWKDQKKSDSKIMLLLIIVFALASTLLPTLTGTLSSMPRYIITAPTIFWGLALLKGWRSDIFLVLSLIMQFCLFALFSSGYFIS